MRYMQILSVKGVGENEIAGVLPQGLPRLDMGGVIPLIHRIAEKGSVIS